MISNVRKRLTYTNVAMTLALVFAMSGGAYAASKYLITSTKQIKPSVLAQLKGKAGPKGATGSGGAAGPQGPKGETGPGGKEGLLGKEGKEGKEGPLGKEGKEGLLGKEGKEGPLGKEGKEGSPWTVKGVLPKGSTETGVWAVRGTAEAENEPRVAAISFPIPLASRITHTTFIEIGETPPAGECKGSVTKPEAEEGHLCVFAGEAPLVHKGGLTPPFFVGPGGAVSDTETTGVELLFQTLNPAKAGEEVSAEGTWAVTAE